jgi:soluble lytic murein transglycosylase-like protein
MLQPIALQCLFGPAIEEVPMPEVDSKRGDLYRPWKQGMPDRRRGMRATPAQRSAQRALLRKLRKPMVGVALIGVGVPMAHAMDEIEEAPRAPIPDPFDAELSASGEDLEERLARRISLTKEVGARNLAVLNAVERYDISRDMAEDIYDAAQESGIDPQVAYGLVKTESTFRERAVSNMGARGLTQVLPRTAKWLRPGTRADDLFDRKTNLSLGFEYLSDMIDKYKGDVKLALLAYNRGPGTVDRELSRGNNPDNGYADKVLRG